MAIVEKMIIDKEEGREDSNDINADQESLRNCHTVGKVGRDSKGLTEEEGIISETTSREEIRLIITF